jgi:hypothetical protein
MLNMVDLILISPDLFAVNNQSVHRQLTVMIPHHALLKLLLLSFLMFQSVLKSLEVLMSGPHLWQRFAQY